MGFNCKKCGMYKAFEKQSCACNAKKFNADKLSKKTRKETQPKAIAQVSEKKKERIKSNGSEINLFKKIFKSKFKKNQNNCLICKTKLTEDNISPSSFAHILPKGKYPEYRYFENNIGLVCGIEHHHVLDDAVNNFKQDKGLLELEKIIKDGKDPDLTDYIDY